MPDTISGYSGSSVLILGGAGFLGSHIARRVATLGARVTIVDAMFEYAGGNPANLHGLPASVELIERDVCAMSDLSQQVASADMVVDAMGTTGHQWAYRRPDLDLAANVTSHLAVLQAVVGARPKPRLVHLSTRSVYGRAQATGIDETHPTQPIDVQGSHKLLAERHIELLGHREGLNASVLRIGNCYGPGQRLSGDDVGLIGGFLRDAMLDSAAVVYGGTDRHRDFLFVDDLADAVLAAGVRTAEGIRVLNIAGASERLVNVAEQTVAAVGKGRVELAPFPDEIGRMDPGAFVMDCSRARQELDWAPKTPLAIGLKETVQYYGAHARSYGLNI